jgi:predicted nuclease of predicted toxin-antitoxin system
MSSPPSSASWQFLVDENLPRALTERLRGEGYVAEDVRDVGLRSQPDPVVFAYAQAHSETIITLDKGLGSLLQYPPPHAGIVAARLPDRLSIDQKVDIIVAGLSSLAGQSLASMVAIIEPGRVRVRR